MEIIRVLVVEKSQEVRSRIINTLAKVTVFKIVGDTDDLDEAAYILGEYQPNVVILGDNLDFDKYILAEHVTQDYPSVALVMLVDGLSDDTIYNAILAGAVDVIVKPFTSSALIDSMYRANKIAKDTTQRPTAGKPTISASSRGQIVSIFSTKGGVGKTLIATNLAVSLEKFKKQRVCLVDMDMELGNVAMALDLEGNFSMRDISSDFENVDQSVIGSYLTQHESRIMVLPASNLFSKNEITTPRHVEITLRSLSALFDYVIVDMPTRATDISRSVYRMADLSLLVTTPELASLSNVNLAVNHLLSLDLPLSKIKVILNMANSSRFIKAKDVEQVINDQLFLKITKNKHALRSLNEGQPIVLSKPRSKLSKTFIKLADLVISEVSQDKQ